MSKSADELIDNSEDKDDDEGCEFCGCPLYPHTEIITNDTMKIEKTYLVCRNMECSNFNSPTGDQIA